jgi:glycosyltransferase involved in cell wall biosynthesis
MPPSQSTPAAADRDERPEVPRVAVLEPGSLTVFLPVHNGADVIEEVLDVFCAKVVSPTSARLLVCEDGSTDGTGAVLDRLAGKYPMRLERADVRKGYAGAVRDGLASVATPFVFFADSDGQYYPEDFWKLVPDAEEYDMVIGRKVNRDEPLHRIVLSRGFHLLVKILTGVRLRDIDCGFRLIRKEVVKDVLREVHDLPYSFWAEFTIVASLKGIRIAEVPVSHHRRLYGKSTIYQPRRLPGILLLQLRGLLRLRRRMRSLVAQPART